MPALTGPERALTAMNGGPLLAPAHLARGAAALSEGRHEDAFRALWPLFDEEDPAFHRFMRWPAALDLAEAGARGEHAAQAAEVMRELEEIAMRSEPPILRAGLACAQPLMSDDDHAEALFVAALERRVARVPVSTCADAVLIRPLAAPTAEKRRLACTPTPSDQPLRRLGSDSLE